MILTYHGYRNAPTKGRPRRAPSQPHQPKRKAPKASRHEFKVHGGLKTIYRYVLRPEVRRRISSLLDFTPTEIYPSDGHLVFTKVPSYQIQAGTFRRAHLGQRGSWVTYGCPVGQWAPKGRHTTRSGKRRTGRCLAGEVIHHVGIPWARVESVVASFMRKVPARPRPVRAAPVGMVANPLLLSVEYPLPNAPKGRRAAAEKSPARKSRRNPLPYTTAGRAADLLVNPCKIPFKKGQKVPIAKFEKWLREAVKAGQVPRDYLTKFLDTVTAYTKFHLGAMPKTMTYEEISMGGAQQLPAEFMFSAGVSPVETYTPLDHSGKAPHSYYHEYKTQPEVLINADGSFVIKPLRKTAKVTDWFYG